MGQKLTYGLFCVLKYLHAINPFVRCNVINIFLHAKYHQITYFIGIFRDVNKKNCTNDVGTPLNRKTKQNKFPIRNIGSVHSALLIPWL